MRFKIVCVFVGVLFWQGVVAAQTGTTASGAASPQAALPYGDNENAGHFAVLNGVKLYYEVYGDGDPLVLLHGNGGNIAAMKNQIEYFSKRYKVIALDCRGRGKSELGQAPLTYLEMTKDVASLLDYLHQGPAYIIGRSDGGIISLLMGIHFPEKVRKIAAFGANLSPDYTAVYPQILEQVTKDHQRAQEMLEIHDTSRNWTLVYQLNQLMETQPHISVEDLHKIHVPVLVMSGDRDLIKEEHTVLIYRSIPRANLCIFPGETHWITSTNPDLFNTTVEKFFSEPYKGEEIRK